ncbi:MAG: Fic family protein [Hyphomonadaceae bacterium]|nr:Fic family protein [Hyphomonadaceae bacterium]
MSPDDLRRTVAEKKAALDRLRPLRGGALDALRKYYDLELTYTSNAIEGNELTARETAEVIEHGITVAGKRLRDHLEAVDHYEAVQWMRELAGAGTPVTEAIVCELHRRIVARSQPAIAGVYSRHPRRILGSAAVFPNPAKVPDLMRDLGVWLETAQSTPETAFDAHLRLVSIHPFSDGNGRTARLLMNLLLLRAGYAPIAVRPEDRAAYLDALEQTHAGGDLAYRMVMYERLDATLADYLRVLDETTG